MFVVNNSPKRKLNEIIRICRDDSLNPLSEDSSNVALDNSSDVRLESSGCLKDVSEVIQPLSEKPSDVTSDEKSYNTRSYHSKYEWSLVSLDLETTSVSSLY